MTCMVPIWHIWKRFCMLSSINRKKKTNGMSYSKSRILKMNGASYSKTDILQIIYNAYIRTKTKWTEMARESKLIAAFETFSGGLFFPFSSFIFSFFFHCIFFGFFFYFTFILFSSSFYVCSIFTFIRFSPSILCMFGFYFLCFKLFGWYVLLLGFFFLFSFFHVGCVTWYHRISKRFITYYSNLARLNNICSLWWRWKYQIYEKVIFPTHYFLTAILNSTKFDLIR